MEDKMANQLRVELAQKELNAIRGELRAAAINFSIPDEKVIELREAFRRADAEFRQMNRKRGLLGLLGL